MTTPRITRIPILPLNMVNAHLVHGPRGCILVDAGLPGSEAQIGRALSRNGLSFGDIKLIVITHAHVDHAGAGHALRELSRAPIVAHVADAEHFSREVPMTFCPTGWAGRLFRKTSVPHTPYRSFTPDILLSGDDILDLARYGIAGNVRQTPGHTRGSISVELSGKHALVGDLVASGILLGGIMRNGRAIRPPFEDDPHAVGVALQCLLANGAEMFHMGHGGPLPASAVRRHAARLLSMHCA